MLDDIPCLCFSYSSNICFLATKFHFQRGRKYQWQKEDRHGLIIYENAHPALDCTLYFNMVFSLCVSLFSTWKKPCYMKRLSFTASFPTTQKIQSLQWKDKSFNYTQESHYHLLRELTEILNKACGQNTCFKSLRKPCSSQSTLKGSAESKSLQNLTDQLTNQ